MKLTIWIVGLLILALTVAYAAQTMDGLVIKARTGTVGLKVTGAPSKNAVAITGRSGATAATITAGTSASALGVTGGTGGAAVGVVGAAGQPAIHITGVTGAASIIAPTHIDAPSSVTVATAAATTVASSVASGTIYITNEAAAGGVTATTYTLPTPVAALAGKVWYFIQLNDVDMILTTAGAASGDCMLTLNTTDAADTMTFGTTGEKIGATGMAICDGTRWFVIPLNGTVTGAG